MGFNPRIGRCAPGKLTVRRVATQEPALCILGPDSLLSATSSGVATRHELEPKRFPAGVRRLKPTATIRRRYATIFVGAQDCLKALALAPTLSRVESPVSRWIITDAEEARPVSHAQLLSGRHSLNGVWVYLPASGFV